MFSHSLWCSICVPRLVSDFSRTGGASLFLAIFCFQCHRKTSFLDFSWMFDISFERFHSFLDNYILPAAHSKKKTELKRRNREERERFLSDCLPYRRTGQGRTGKRREEPIRTGKTSAAHSNALDIDVYSRNRPRICKP